MARQPKIVYFLAWLVCCEAAIAAEAARVEYVGRSTCAECHEQQDAQWTGSHHFHPPESNGASCAECHMPPKTYMVVDPRHDHSMRIPRPDLSVILGTPNACNQCHVDKDAQWAADQVKAWYDDTPDGFQTYANAFHDLRNEQAGVGNTLATLIRDARTPAIARATALAELGPYLSARTIDVLPLALSDDDASVREAALSALVAFHRDQGNQEAAGVYVEKLRALSR